MKKYIEYHNRVTEILGKILETQADKIESAIDTLFGAFTGGHSLFVFGAAHAGIITEEMYGRAGGLMVVNPIFNATLMLDVRPITLTSEMERFEGFGQIILNNTKIQPGDVLVLHSVSGRNSVAIDMALEAKKRGITLVGITSLDYGNYIKSRHSSGKLLSELCDIVIDNCGEFGDGCVPVGSDGVKAGATSTVAGAAIVNMIAVGFAEKCSDAGIEPPVFESANSDSGQERMVRMVTKYYNQIHYI